MASCSVAPRFVIPDGGELRIYGVISETIALFKNDMETIGRWDQDLANQMRRAATSMALNVSERTYSRGRNRQVRYHTALGSARETLGCIEVGVALGYLHGVRDDLRERMRHILGTLTKLTR